MGISSKDPASREGSSTPSTSSPSGAEDGETTGALTRGEFRQIVSEDSKDWVIKLWSSDVELLSGGVWITVCNQESEDGPYIPLRYSSKLDAELAMAIYFRDELIEQKSGGPILVKACFSPPIDWYLS